RRAGNSNCAHWIAARTRSLASRTAASGRPTIDMAGSPPARCTSTRTSGARTPTRARLCTIARPMVAASVAGRLREVGQFGQARCQGVELLARAQQHGALHVAFLAGDQLQLAQTGLQHRLEVLLQFFATLAQPGWHQVAEAAGEFVELGQVD